MKKTDFAAALSILLLVSSSATPEEASFDQDGSANIVCTCKQPGKPFKRGENSWVATISVKKGMKLDDRALSEVCYRHRDDPGITGLCETGDNLENSLKYFSGKKQ